MEGVWDYKSLSSPEFKPLSPEEERELAIRAKNGDKDALDRIIKSNVRFVVALARRIHLVTGAPFEDLISEGLITLYDVFKKFDPNRGVRFVIFAEPYLYKAMYNFVKFHNKVLSNMPKLTHKELGEIIKLYQELGREPSIEEISQRLKIGKRRAKRMKDAIDWKMLKIESLDREIDEDHEIFDTYSNLAKTPLDLVEEEYRELKMEEIVNAIFESDFLSDKEKRVIWEHIFEGKDLAEIGREMGYSREYIRQLKNSAIKKIKEKFPKIESLL